MGRLIILLLALLGTSRAADKVDCTTLAVDTNWFVSYKTQATFPDPPKTVDLKLYNRTTPYQFNACGVGVPPENRTNLTRDEGSPPVLSWKARPTL